MKLTELETSLAIKVLETYEKAFVLKKYRDIASTAHANVLFQMGLQDPAVMKAGLNAYNSGMAAFRVDLVDVYAKYSAGTYDMSQAMSRAKEIFGDRYQELFKAGAMATGNIYYKEVGLTRKDMAFISAARRRELGFFRQFLTDVRDSSHIPRHPYNQRAMYYGESGRAQYFNGMVAGFGTDMEIRWVVDYAAENCPDCIRLSMRTWNWETLPTVPRAGDTQCIFRCRCFLDFKHKGSLRQFEVGGRATSYSLMAAGRYSRVYDSAGKEVGGALQQMVEDISARMNKARQMIEVTYGEDKLRWIAERSSLNQQLIEIQGSRKVSIIPSISVADLELTVEGISKKGGFLIANWANLSLGDEVLFIRSDFSAAGILVVERNVMTFKSGSNISVAISEATDIIYSLGNQIRNQSIGTMSISQAQTVMAVGSVNVYKQMILSNQAILPVVVDKSNISMILSGSERAQAYRELGYDFIPVVRVSREQFFGDLAEFGEEEALRLQGWR